MATSNHFKTHNFYVINGISMECLKGCTLYGMSEVTYTIGILEHKYEVYKENCIFDTIVFDYHVVIREMSASGRKVVKQSAYLCSDFAKANDMYKDLLCGLN